MKTKGLFFLILTIIIGCSTSSNDSNSPNEIIVPIDNTAAIEQIINTMQLGTWRITSLVDSGQEKTIDFDGIIFTFNSSGTLIAIGPNDTKVGNWSVSDNSNALSDIDFNISFEVPPNDKFDDLLDTWLVGVHSSTLMTLNDGNDILVFEQN